MESEIEQLCWLYAKKKEVIGVDLKEQGDEFHRNTKSVIINS
jgi:hypothetical protein